MDDKKKAYGVIYGSVATRAFSNNFGVGIDDILHTGKSWCTIDLYFLQLFKEVSSKVISDHIKNVHDSNLFFLSIYYRQS